MSEQESVTILGKAVHIIFRNDTTMYTVMRFRLHNETEKIITVTGLFPAVDLDILYNITGHYVEHPRYGMQFAMESYEKPLPNEREGIIRYLSGVQFPGIGKKTAEKVVDTFGEECLDLIKEDPDILKSIKELSEDKRRVIYEGIMRDDDGMNELVQFLNVHGIGIRNLVRLNKAYGKEALTKLKENPYRVIDECDGFGFATADKIAMSLGFREDDDRRLYAYLVSLCMDLCVASGDSWVDEETLHNTFMKKTAGLSCEYEDIFHQALMNRRIVQEEDRVFPVSQYDAEAGIASFLKNFPFSYIDEPDMHILERYLRSL